MHHFLEYESVPISSIPAELREPCQDPLRPVVLVVDDERIIADTLAAILNLSGYAAMAAYDAESALELAGVIPPDLGITDVMMPGMSGVELAMTLSRQVPETKFLLFSGQAATLDFLATSREAGFEFPALAKPVHPTVMLAQVSKLVPRYATQYLV